MLLTKENLEEEIQKILRQIIEKYHPEKVVLFGSAAGPGSAEINDLDFLIIKEDVPYYGLDRLYEIDSLIKRNVPVDMLVYKPAEIEERLRMGDPFVKKMIYEGQVLYG